MNNTIKSLLLLGGTIVVVGLLALWYVSYEKVPNILEPSGQNTISDQEPIVLPGKPMRLKIPSIGVDAPVTQVGLTSDGAVGVPKGPFEAAWFNRGPLPGAKGSAVITGHYGPWITGANSVFDNLSKLKTGDMIYVEDENGTVFTFEVSSSKMYDANASVPEIFNKTDGTYLNIITCQGDWLANQKTYNQRLVVFTKMSD